MIKCPVPACGSLRGELTDSRPYRDGKEIRRRRHCLACGHRWTTLEINLARLQRLTPPTTGSSTSTT